MGQRWSVPLLAGVMRTSAVVAFGLVAALVARVVPRAPRPHAVFQQFAIGLLSWPLPSRMSAPPSGFSIRCGSLWLPCHDATAPLVFAHMVIGISCLDGVDVGYSANVLVV